MQKSHPKTILKKMMDDFSEASSALLEIKFSTFHENVSEKAVYGVLYGKPSKRLATLLSINREVLVIFSSFTSQQARTVKAVINAIENGQGRLETTLAIVVHSDPGGNSKLRSWGKEHGISLLPLFYVEVDFPMLPEVFEKSLCSEMFSIDPFDITGPVSDDSHFYGRRTEAQTIARQLQYGQIKATLGIRKIGKTSIINRIVETCREYHDCMIVMADCSNNEIWSLTAVDLIISIYNTIKKMRETQANYSILFSSKTEESMSECTAKLINEIGLNKVPIITIFDEVDYITPGSPTGTHWSDQFNDFWRNYRVVYQECSRIKKPFSVLISGVSSKWFRVESINNIENSALALVPEDYLSPLPRGATIAMIKSLARIAGLQFSDEAAELVSESCCDSPYWVRKACSYIHKKIDIHVRPAKIDLELLKIMLAEFVDSEGAVIAKVALKHLFKVYPELKEFCRLVYDGQPNDIPKSYYYTLSKYGLIKEITSGVVISGTMVMEGLRLIFNDIGENEQLDVYDEMPTEKSAYEEWADELALINKRRNILERKLRSIVLNFIRQDSLVNKSKPTAKLRVLNRIEEKRRKQIESFSSDELMEKLLWTDLCVVINKEWSLFEQIFGDKNGFNLHSSIINDRFDAHAKSVDVADLALYRRSLNWFDNCLSAI
jgi:hypothetical protein